MSSAHPAGMVDTPPRLARLLVERLPHPLPPVLDPSCGSGALLLAAARRDGPVLDEEHGSLELWGIEADRSRLTQARAALHGLGARLILADALELASDPRPETGWPAGTWIAANPPWTSRSGRQAVEDPSRPDALAGWPASHADFLVAIAEHVARESTGALVLLPASVLELERYGPLRAEVTRLVRVVEPIEELEEDAFPGVTEPSILLELAPRREDSPDADPTPWGRVPHALIDQLARLPRAPAGTFADAGVHSGNSARELVLPAQATGAGLRQGRDLADFALSAPSACLNTELVPTRARRFRVPPLERHQAFPILLRQTADRPRAALHVEPTWFRNSLLACRGIEGLDDAVLVAFLNSELAAEVHRARFRDARQRTFPQVKISHLNELPLPLLRRDDAPRLHDELARRVRSWDPRVGPEGGARGAVERLVRRAYEEAAGATLRTS